MLLRPATTLTAVTVEGAYVQLADGSEDKSQWEAVDCGLYFGGNSLDTAGHVDLAQLKYSGSNPDGVWSVARITNSTSVKKNNSVLRKLCDTYKDARSKLKPGATLNIKLVSNQNASTDLKQAVAVRWSGKIKDAGFENNLQAQLQQLHSASGLTEDEFAEFLAAFDLSACGHDSRFALQEKIIEAVASLMGDNVATEVSELLGRVRSFMLPERHREFITQETVLSWLDLGAKEGLFPAPAIITLPDNPIPREAAKSAAALLKDGTRLVIVHGDGGCGKTTLLHQIKDHISPTSIAVVFDCFGGGSYMYREDRRHLSEVAFLQLVNDLALATQLPLFLPRRVTNPASLKAFLAKLRLAAVAFEKLTPDGLLLIIVDAADNSVSAAQNADPPDRPFIYDLFEANLEQLPKNVRFIVSCRSSRRDTMNIPSFARQVPCPGFSEEETYLNLQRRFSDIDKRLAKEFHELSDANPRVQSYAITNAKGDKSQLLEGLLPAGKTLSDVLNLRFKEALEKLGQNDLFDKLIGALAFLPPPISLGAVAGAAGTSEAIVRDFATDLRPGVLLKKDGLTVADEDFEAFIREQGKAHESQTREAIANYFEASYRSKAYSSEHIADGYIAAGRAQDLLDILERDPKASAIPDPVIRRRTQVRRLKLSLAACREAGSVPKALQVILMSADARSDDRTLQDVLEKELDLSVEFGGYSVKQAILLDADRVADHGSFLAQDAARAARNGDNRTAIEQLRFYSAWLDRRKTVSDKVRQRWNVTHQDIAAEIEAIFYLRGATPAFRQLMRWQPRSVAIRVALSLIPKLIAKGHGNALAADLLRSGEVLRPFDLLLTVPLAVSGIRPDTANLNASLKAIRLLYLGKGPVGGYSGDRSDDVLLEFFFRGLELGYQHGVARSTLKRGLRLLSSLLERGELFASDIYRVDLLLRAWFLREALNNKLDPKSDDFLKYLDRRVRAPKPLQQASRVRSAKPARRTKAANSRDDDKERRNRKLGALYPIYQARFEILTRSLSGTAIDEPILGKLNALRNSYELSLDYDSGRLRERAARSVIQLLTVPDVDASALLKQASVLITDRFGDPLISSRASLWSEFRLRADRAPELVSIASAAAKVIRENRFASSDKIQGLLRLARLLLPVSRPDAEGLFNQAVEIAKEIDREAIDQIDFLASAATRASLPNDAIRQKIAIDFATFTAGAAVRLDSSDDFPWAAAVSALTVLAPPLALAAISRWQDEGLVGFGTTLQSFLAEGLKRKTLRPEIAVSLMPIFWHLPTEVVHSFLNAEEVRSRKDLTEQIFADITLLQDQPQRSRSVGEMTAPSQSGPWHQRLVETRNFLQKSQAHSARQDVSQSTTYEQSSREQDRYQLDVAGKTFTTPELINQALDEAEASGRPHSAFELLRKMREATQPKDRLLFLGAVLKISQDKIWITDRSRAVIEALEAWSGSPAVDAWCRDVLPRVISENLLAFVVHMDEGYSTLPDILRFVNGDAVKQTEIILTGIAIAVERISPRTLYKLAVFLVTMQSGDDLAIVLGWYSQLTRNRLYKDEQADVEPLDLPKTLTESIARFLYALLSDIDTRIRWRAAHAVRRLGRLGASDIISGLLEQSSRSDDRGFRDPNAPFYDLAAKLYLALTVARMSHEASRALATCKAQLMALLSDELPHVAIREYTKHAVLNLVQNGTLQFSDSELNFVRSINVPIRRVPEKKNASFRDMDRNHGDNRRFKFDEMDTLPYWYSDIFKFFPTSTQDQILTIAETWIIDKWGAPAEANYYDKEPRKRRQNDRDYNLTSHRHGSLPTVERYGRYLEWHALHCTAGQLLSSLPVSAEENWGGFEYWLARSQPSEPPYWVSDFRGSTPLDRQLWFADPKSDSMWLRGPNTNELLSQVLNSYRPAWVCVEGYISIHSPRRDGTIFVKTALVSPETAPSLVRALQTVDNPWDFGFPNDDDDDDRLAIDRPPYRLLGWLRHSESDLRFDEHDPLRYEIRNPRVSPGLKLGKMLSQGDLVGTEKVWNCVKSGEPALIHEAWCDEPAPSDHDRYSDHMRTDGHRLWISPPMLRAFLQEVGMDLILEVQCERRLRSSDGSYGEGKNAKTSDKIFLFTRNGEIIDARGRIKSWA